MAFPIAIALFFVSASLRADVPAGNFWHNPTFEAGVNLDMATGTPDFWNRGGADGSILQPSTANSVSATHSLGVIKPVAGPSGEWYSDLPLAGLANSGDTVNLHWHEIYSISGGEMRLTVRFLDGGGNGGDNHFVVTGDSAGWAGSAAASTFSVRNQQLLVNTPGAVTMRIQLVSGGGDLTTGIYLIDDLSVVPEPATSPPVIISQPMDQMVNPGQMAMFSVTVAQPLQAFYQWRLNGVNIPGATNSDYVIPNVQPTSGGSFQVIVSNAEGVTNSAAAILMVNGSPFLPFADNFGQGPHVSNPMMVVFGTNAGATKESGEPNHAGKVGTNSVWFSWRAMTNGIVTFRTKGSTFDTLLAAYFGSAVSNLVGVASDDDSDGFLTSRISFNVMLGQEYQIAVAGLGGAQGKIVLSWELEPTPDILPVITEHPHNQTVGLSGTAFFSVGTMGGLPNNYQWFTNGVPIPGANAADLIVQNVQIPNVGLYFVRVFNGPVRFVDSRVASLQISIVGEDKQVQGLPTAEKFYDLYDALNPPPGQPFAGSKKKPVPQAAAVVLGYTGTQIFSTYGSMSEPGEQPPCNVVGGASQWFAYSPPSNGQLHLNTEGSLFDTVVAVYTTPGLMLATLAPVMCDNNSGTNGLTSKLNFQAASGTIYYISVDGVSGVTGTVHLNYRLLVPLVLTNIVKTNLTMCKFLVKATPSYNFTIQRSSNLVDWTSVLTTYTTNGTYNFSDTNAPNTVNRFYRATQTP